MKPDIDSYWKTVVAEVSPSATETESCLGQAANNLGFVPSGTSRLRSGWLLLIPTRHEWRISVEGGEDGAIFSIRFGLRPGFGYYLAILGMFASAIALCPLLIAASDALLFTGTAMAILFLLPVAHGFAARWQANRLERQLWQAVAKLGPWRSSRVIMRSLIGYVPDAVIENKDLATAFRGNSVG